MAKVTVCPYCGTTLLNSRIHEHLNRCQAYEEHLRRLRYQQFWKKKLRTEGSKWKPTQQHATYERKLNPNGRSEVIGSSAFLPTLTLTSIPFIF